MAVGAAPQGLAVPRLIGRDRERAAIRQALSGPPVVVLLEGEAGIGKSRLVREVLAEPGWPPGRALIGTCPPFRKPFTLGPVIDALRQADDRVAGLELSALAGTLRPFFPEWAGALPEAPEPLADPTAARHQLFRALMELLQRLGAGVLVVEDAHWADEVSLEFLLFLAARQPPVLSVLVTYRPEEVPEGSLLRRLSAGAGRVRVSLPPLDVGDTTRMVSSMLHDEPVSAEFADFLFAHTDGVPLAVEESLRLLYDRADLVQVDGGWVRRDVAELEVPANIRDAVRERVTRFGEPAQRVLRAAAVLFDPADEATVVAVSGLPAEQAGPGLAEALGSGLVVQDGHGLVSFRHVLACRAVYEAIPAGERRGWHLRAGTVLEGAARLPVAQLARHFREAGQTERWSGYAEQAADLALSSGDPKTAFTLLFDLLTRAEVPPSTVDRLMHKLPLGAAVGDAWLGDLVRALRTVLAADGLSPAERGGLGWHLGRMLFHAGDVDAGLAEVERAVPYLADRSIDAAHAMMMLGLPYGTLRPVSEHREWLDRVAAIEANASMSEAHRLALVGDRAAALLMLGDEAGWPAAAKLPAEGGTVQEIAQIARGYGNLGDEAMRWGRYGDARRWLTAAAERAAELQLLRLGDIVAGGLVHLDWFVGAWAGLAERSAALAEPTGEQAEGVLVAGLLHAADGAPEEAERRLRSALAAGRRRGVDGSIEPAAALARLCLSTGRVDEALGFTEEPMTVIVTKRIWLWATDIAPVRLQALLAADQGDEAAQLVSAFASGLGARAAPAPQAALVACRAVLAEGRGQPERAATLFGQAAEAWRALPRPYEALLCQERQAGSLLAAGRAEDGLAQLTRVFQELTDLGAPGDAERVRRTLHGHGARLPRAGRAGRPGYGDQLSPRELEVVRLLATGRTNREIADTLVLSQRTVEAHIVSAMRKRKATSRTALLMGAVRDGLVPVRQEFLT